MNKLVIIALLALLLPGMCAAGPLLRLQHSTFDPLSQTTPPGLLQEKSDAAPDGARYYIVQFQGPIFNEWKAEAQSAGAELLDYIPDFAFVARASDDAAAKLKALPSVRWVGDYAPAYRLSQRLPAQGTADVVIRLFPGADTGHVAKRITEAGGRLAAPAEEHRRNIRASIPASALARVARTAGIAWIEPWVERRLLNNTARSITTVGDVWAGMGLYGAGQVIAVADTGLDNGKNDSSLSADFRGRVLKTYALGRTNDWSDDHGHGTHVAGSILGSGSLSGSNPATHSYSGSFAGVAPEASLVFQSVLDRSGNLGGLPNDLNDLYDPPYQDGARVHSNSWGAAVYGVYDPDSYNTDLYTWNHKDMVIVYAAGNEGVDTSPADGFIDSDSIDSPGTAKNCITVGASESLSNGGLTDTYYVYWGSIFATNPIRNDRLSNNSIGMAAFSSRGPTDDGRIKPDICGPGTNIISCRSHDPKADVLWAAYNTNYVYSGGTSMSTPLAAGACALVREFYVGRGMTPSAALVKATLINGAFDMTPGQYASPQEIPARPNDVEGVDISSPATGLHTVNVFAYNVPHGPQPYALVVSGPVSSVAPALPANIAAAKALSDGSVVTLMGKLVSAGSDQFKNQFYIQEPDRSSGIRVQYGPGGGPLITEGMTVTVTGTLATIAGERVIKDPIVSV